MKTINGNLIHLAKAGHFDVIVHGCNCFGKWGAGLAAQMKLAFPPAYQADQLAYHTGYARPGKYSQVTVCHPYINSFTDALVIINAYTQYRYSRTEVVVDEDAIAQVFRKLKQDYGQLSIGIPMIGAGLAGGKWECIEPIIAECLHGSDVTVVKYCA